MLDRLIVGEPAIANGRRCILVVQRQPFPFNVGSLGTALLETTADDYVGYVVAFDTPLWARLLTMLALRLQLRRVERFIVRNGLVIVGRYAVEPSVTTPMCVFELDSAAATYADRHLRPSGGHPHLRWLLARFFGCDPGLGGVVVIASRPCS